MVSDPSRSLDERSLTRILQSLSIQQSSSEDTGRQFWVSIFTFIQNSFDLSKLDLFHKTNLLWTISQVWTTYSAIGGKRVEAKDDKFVR